MGSGQAKASTPQSNYAPEVEVVHAKSSNPHYGEVRVVRDLASGQQLILKDLILNTEQAFETESQFLNQRIELRHPNVAEIVGYNTKDQKNFCSTYYKLSIYIEDLPQTLQAQLEERISSYATYTETEILQVADSLISGLSYFQSQGFSHGDIRPANIFVSGPSFKLSDPSLSAQKGQNALSIAILHGTKTNLAPELVPNVPQSDFEIKTDKYKADVFSLGLTLLSLASLSSNEEIYNLEEGTFNEALLNEKLEKIRFRYSPFTWDLIKSMLTVSEESRPDFVSLNNTLLPYQESIRSGASLYVYGKTEGVKRSGLPDEYDNTAYSNSSNDDLEARIRAALERSEATFKAVAARDHAYASGELAKQYLEEGHHAQTSGEPVVVVVEETVVITSQPAGESLLQKIENAVEGVTRHEEHKPADGHVHLAADVNVNA